MDARETDRKRYQTEREIYLKINRGTDRRADGQMDKQTTRYADRWTEIQKD
jgi:hypothetical protein